MFTALALGLSATLPGSASAHTTEQATLEVTKECIGTDDGTDFTITVSPGGYSTVLGCGESDAFFVDPGSYTVAETPPAGWIGPNIRGGCDGDGTITLESGDEETCVVQNVAEEETATLFIVKECIGTDDGTNFTINISGIGSRVLGCGDTSGPITVDANTVYTVSENPPAGWTGPNIRGLCDGDGTFTLDPDDDGTCVVQNVAEEETATLFIVKECIGTDDGTNFTLNISGIGSRVLGCGDTSGPITVDANTVYTVSENPPAGWTGPNIRGLCDGDGTFSLDPDDDGTCVVQNVAEEETATLFIEKECIGTDDGTVFPINVSGGIGTVNLECGETSDPITVDANTVYTVSENPPAGWTGPDIRGLCDGDGTFTLDPDDEGTCVVTNTAEEATATLFIEKECVGTDDGTDFTINVSGGIGPVVLGCGETSDPITVDADVEYTVSETPPAGWTGPDIRGLCDGDGTFTLDPDDEGTCVVTNTAEEMDTATLFIVKECAEASDDEFEIELSGFGSVFLSCGEMSDGITIESGVEYVVSEDAPDGWLEPSIRGACDGDGTVTLDEGEDGTCVVRNTPEEEPLPPANIVIEVQQPPAAPVEQVAGVQQVITPPNTGDGGLVATERSSTGMMMIPMLILTGAIGLVAALSAKRLRHLKR